jgi:cell division protein FtsB
MVSRRATAEEEDETRTPPRPDTVAVPPMRRGRRLVHTLVFFIAFLVVIDALVGDKGLLATMRARSAYSELAADLTRARAENARLREEARRLREDPDTIEAIARRELGLIRPGEKLFIIKDRPSPHK